MIMTMLEFRLQHHKQFQDLSISELLAEGRAADDDPNMSLNLLTVASTGNAAFLDELLKARLDPDIGDANGRTPLVCFSFLGDLSRRNFSTNST